MLPDERHEDVKVVAFDAEEQVQPPHHLEQHPNHERTRKVHVQYRKTNSETIKTVFTYRNLIFFPMFPASVILRHEIIIFMLLVHNFSWYNDQILRQTIILEQ